MICRQKSPPLLCYAIKYLSTLFRANLSIRTPFTNHLLDSPGSKSRCNPEFDMQSRRSGSRTTTLLSLVRLPIGTTSANQSIDDTKTVSPDCDRVYFGISSLHLPVINLCETRFPGCGHLHGVYLESTSFANNTSQTGSSRGYLEACLLIHVRCCPENG